MNITYKQKSIIMAFICACLVFAIGITIYFLIDSLNEDKVLESEKAQEAKMYAVVLKKGANYIIVDPIDADDEVLINTMEDVSEGDFIVITYNEEEENITPNSVEVIAENMEVIVTSDEEVTTTKITTTKVSTTSKSTTTKSNTTTKKSTSTTKKTTTTTVILDEDIISYAKLSYDEADSASEDKSITSSIKEKFVLLIDFIFYEGEIKGKTFKELSDSAKAKVIYYTLLLDSKIDSKWPDYKNTIKSKASDLKEKLIAKYMDITTSLCASNESGCEYVKSDFALLKKSLNLTWDIIKSAFSYGYNKTYTYLKTWYEVWREK